MTVEDLYNWLVDNRYNALAANVNQAAGLWADALSDPGGDLYIKEPDDEEEPRDALYRTDG